MLACNKYLYDAYQLLSKGQLHQSINQYQLALKNTYNNTLKNNIRCTISILQYHLGKDSSHDMIESVLLNQSQQHCNLVTLRTIINCILIDILQGRSARASQYFDTVLQIIQQEPSLYQRRNLIQYISYLFFRVRSFQQIGEFIESMDLKGLRLQQIFSVSLMAFNSQICQQQSQQRVQKQCYEQFIAHKRYDLAIFCLRSLIKFTVNNLPNRQFYEKQLGKLIMLGYFNDDIDCQNYQAYQTMQDIIDKFIKYQQKLTDQISKVEMKNVLAEKSLAKKIQQSDAQVIVEWRYTIMLMMKQLKRNKQIDGDSKQKIKQILSEVRKEENILVIRSMSKNNYFAKYNQKVYHVFNSLSNPLQYITFALKQGFQMIKNAPDSITIPEVIRKEVSSNKSRLSLKSQKRSSLSKAKAKPKEKEAADKENNPPMGISIVSITSSKISNGGRKKIFEESRAVYQTRKLQKMVKICESGGFLNKRNYNSEGGEYRFVKITSSFIKWGKDPQKIESNYQIYPLKDIKSIVYGRVSPNLNQSCNKMLAFSKCFTLLLQKRTLDFYCKNYEEIQSWVCGISVILKRQQVKVVGYTPGKLRWKKMFATLKQSFIEPLRGSGKDKYYYQKAYSLILFKKNGYKLSNISK